MRGVEETNGGAALAPLPYDDEHAYEVAADAARLLGCEDEDGFHVAGERPPARAAAGELDRSRVRAETRAEFPGFKGTAYRALVIGTRGHVVVTRRILAAVKHRAERA